MLWKPTVLSLGHQFLVVLPEVDGVSSYNVVTLLWRRLNWLLLKAVASLLGCGCNQRSGLCISEKRRMDCSIVSDCAKAFNCIQLMRKKIFANQFWDLWKRSGCIFIPDSLQIFKPNICRNTLERIPVDFSYDLTLLLICPITQNMNDHNSFPSPALMM